MRSRILNAKDEWFSKIATNELSATGLGALQDYGFAVIPGRVPTEKLARIADAYDFAVGRAGPDVLRVGSTTTRVHDLLNWGPEFDDLYIYQPILNACCQVFGQPFKLSSFLARTVRAYSPAQSLHVDCESAAPDWSMVGFIFMVDDFRCDNGATRFIRGSHKWRIDSEKLVNEHLADDERQVYACGPAGSFIIYSGSVLHGHAANQTNVPRRSIQGAFIQREAEPAFNWASRMQSETLGRIGPLAKYLLAI